MDEKARAGGTGVAHTLFVNQIPYSATREDIAAHFAQAAHQDAETLLPSVRVLTKVGRDGTAIFNGTCFLDMPDAEALRRGVALHGEMISCADGTQRSINVREALTKKQLAVVAPAEFAVNAKAVRKLVADAVRDGRVMAGDVDERAMEYLCAIPLDVARRAIAEFAALNAADGLAGVANRSSFFMGLVRQRQLGNTNQSLARGGGKGGKGEKGGKGGKGRAGFESGGRGKGKGTGWGGGGRGGKGGGKGGGDADGGDESFDGAGGEDEGELGSELRELLKLAKAAKDTQGAGKKQKKVWMPYVGRVVEAGLGRDGYGPRWVRVGLAVATGWAWGGVGVGQGCSRMNDRLGLG